MSIRDIPLWYYQQEAQDAALHWHTRLHKHRMVIELPTGSGKTRTALAIIKAFFKINPRARALFITDRIDLVAGTVKDFLEFCDRSDLGVIWQDLNQLDRRITIVSKQTLEEAGRLDALLSSCAGPFPLVFIDECHGAATTSYTRLIERVLMPQGLLIGLSATPYRSDGRNLQRVFTDGLCYSKDPFELMMQDYIADIVTHNYPTNLDMGSLVLKDGDYSSVDELSPNLLRKLLASNRYEVALSAWREHGQGTPTIFFGHNLPDAYAFRDYVVKQGVTCEVVEGRTSTTTRTGYYQRLVEGTLEIISNFNVLTTGFNMPELGCIILGRTTDFRGTIAQIIGRGTRICVERGKTFCTLINLTGTNPVLCSMGLLTGSMDTDAIGPSSRGQSLKQALTIQLEEEIGPLELVGDMISTRDPIQKVYDIHIQLEGLRSEAYDIFTGSGWKGDATTGLYTKACPPYGHIEVERYFMGHVITHVYDTGVRRQVEPLALPLREALARAQKEIVYQHERARMLDGTSEKLKEPITSKQYTHLKNRNVPMPPKGIHMLQSHYVEIAEHIDHYGGAFTKDGGCIGFMQDRYTGEWVVARWAYTGSRRKGAGKKPTRQAEGKQQETTTTTITTIPTSRRPPKQKLASHA